MSLIEAKWKLGALGYPFRKAFNDTYFTISVAAKEAMVTAATIIREKGRANIRAAGYFGDKWANDLTVTVYPTGDRPSAFPKAYVTHKAGANFAGLFEYGQTVSSNRLMWVPFDTGGRTPSGNRAQLMTPKRAAAAYGLDYIPPMGRRKVPILARKRKSHTERMQPVFFGIYTFTMEPKWGITAISQEQAAKLPDYYNEIFDKLEK